MIPVAYRTLRVPMSSALDQGSIIGVSSVAHLRDGNRAFKVWNEHSSSVLPSRWGKEIKQKYGDGISIICTVTTTNQQRGNVWRKLLVFHPLLPSLRRKNNSTFTFHEFLWWFSDGDIGSVSYFTKEAVDCTKQDVWEQIQKSNSTRFYLHRKCWRFHAPARNMLCSICFIF